MGSATIYPRVAKQVLTSASGAGLLFHQSSAPLDFPHLFPQASHILI